MVGCLNGREIGRSVARCRRLFTEQSVRAAVGADAGADAAGAGKGERGRERVKRSRCGVWCGVVWSVWPGVPPSVCSARLLVLLGKVSWCLRFLPLLSHLPPLSPLSYPALLPCPALPHSHNACSRLTPGPTSVVRFCLCCGYSTSLFALRIVVGRAIRQRAQGLQAHTPSDSSPGCQGRVRHASGSWATVALTALCSGPLAVPQAVCT